MTSLRGYVTVGEAARRLGLSNAMVKYLAHHGKLEAKKPGRDLLITERSLPDGAPPSAVAGESVFGNALDSYITVPEAARRTGLTPGYFVNLIHRQKLPAQRMGRDWFVEVQTFKAMFGARLEERAGAGVMARSSERGHCDT